VTRLGDQPTYSPFECPQLCGAQKRYACTPSWAIGPYIFHNANSVTLSEAFVKSFSSRRAAGQPLLLSYTPRNWLCSSIFLFLMLALVGIVGLVMLASFVEAAGHLAQTVDDVLFLHGVCPAVAIRRQKGDRAGLDGQGQHHALSREGSPEHKTLYHKQRAPLSQKLFSEAGHAGRRVRRPPGRCAMLRKTAFWPLPVWYAI